MMQVSISSISHRLIDGKLCNIQKAARAVLSLPRPLVCPIVAISENFEGYFRRKMAGMVAGISIKAYTTVCGKAIIPRT